MLIEKHGYKFHEFICLREGKDNLDQPHVISCDPPMKLPASIERIIEAFKKSREVPIGKEVSKEGGESNVNMKSKKIMIAGAAVRDHLMGRTPTKYELVTDAHPDEVERIVSNARPAIHVIKKDPKAGTVKVSVDGDTYEIETMKKSSGPAESTPIFTTDPKEDHERRDTTVNALYYDPNGKKVYDFSGGLRHLKDGTVKMIGKAGDRLKKDGMAKFRTAGLISKMSNGHLSDDDKEDFENTESDDDVAPEKIRDEFWNGLEDAHVDAAKYIKTYENMKLLDKVFPGLELNMEFPTCKTCKSKPIVLASLLKNNKPPKLVEKLKELKYSDRDIRDAVFLVNMLLFKPEYIYDFKTAIIRTSLTRRQVMDWAKVNNLDNEMVSKMFDHQMSTSPDEMEPDAREQIRNKEAQAFIKNLQR